MREFKFRAWLDYEERMIEWEKLHLETSENGLFLWVGDDEEDNFGSASGESDFKLMQYTGLKDKNGVEIYEGDILDYQWKSSTRDLLIVEWSEKDACFLIGFVKTDYAIAYGEVVGNIYENPELAL